MGQVSNIDIRLLKIFIKVVECGGISAAELELNISASTISKHLKDLELRLGFKLCNRGRSGFQMTKEGELIYQSALNLMSSLSLFTSKVNEVHKHLVGNINLAIFDSTVTNSACKVSQAIAEFSKASPDVELNIYIEPLNAIEQGILEGRYNLGVIPPIKRSSLFNYYPLFSEQMYLYCGNEHALFNKQCEPREVVKYPLAVLGFHSRNFEQAQHFQFQKTALAFNQQAITTFILSGVYLGFLPQHYALRFEEQKLLRPVLPNDFTYSSQFEAVIRSNPEPSRVTQKFLDALLLSHNK